MITTIVRIAVLRMLNNRQELLLTFLVPVLFFTIFALIFSRGVGTGVTQVKVAIIDDHQSSLTEKIRDSLGTQAALEIDPTIYQSGVEWTVDRLGKDLLQRNDTAVVIYFPYDFGQRGTGGQPVAVQLLREGTSPIASEMVSALLTQAMAAAMPTKALTDRIAHPQQPGRSVRSVNASIHQPIYRLPRPEQHASRGELPRTLPGIETMDVFQAQKHNPKIAMYAAGIAVMFLLFSASGAGGSLLEEFEAGTLDRLLTSQLTLGKLLVGKWIYITGLGMLQLTVMFIWAQLAFGVDLVGHWAGFLVMAGCTAAATASLALCLAVFCPTRNVLNGISIVVILAMSALGGSMIPRYIMSDQMQRLGKLTFNGWALDGFKKVFWYDLPVNALTQEVGVLLLMALYLGIVARVFADRWTAK